MQPSEGNCGNCALLSPIIWRTDDARKPRRRSSFRTTFDATDWIAICAFASDAVEGERSYCDAASRVALQCAAARPKRMSAKA